MSQDWGAWLPVKLLLSRQGAARADEGLVYNSSPSLTSRLPSPPPSGTPTLLLPSTACSKQVAFPPRLKMKRSWLAADSGERNVEYELVSTVVHHGKTISSGHYTADVRQPDDRWAHRVRRGKARHRFSAQKSYFLHCKGGLHLHRWLNLASLFMLRTALPGCSWLRFDDGNVFQVKQQEVLTNRPYLLFYQRVA